MSDITQDAVIPSVNDAAPASTIKSMSFADLLKKNAAPLPPTLASMPVLSVPAAQPKKNDLTRASPTMQNTKTTPQKIRQDVAPKKIAEDKSPISEVTTALQEGLSLVHEISSPTFAAVSPVPSVNVWQQRMQQSAEADKSSAPSSPSPVEHADVAKENSSDNANMSSVSTSSPSPESTKQPNTYVKKNTKKYAQKLSVDAELNQFGNLPTPASSPYTASVANSEGQIDGSFRRRENRNRQSYASPSSPTGAQNVLPQVAYRGRGRGDKYRSTGTRNSYNGYQRNNPRSPTVAQFMSGPMSAPVDGYYHQQSSLANWEMLNYYILGQVEYYFSVENLLRDVYFRGHMDQQGFVSMDLIAGFNRVKTLSADAEFVKQVSLNILLSFLISQGHSRVASA